MFYDITIAATQYSRIAFPLCGLRAQAGLKGTPQSSLLMSTFEGTQITQLICPKPATITDASTGPPRATVDDSNREGVGNGDSSAAVKGQDQEQSQGDRAEEFDTRERGETFMCLSLEVKNMVGVEDALEKLTEKEVIEGYTWDDKVCVLRETDCLNNSYSNGPETLDVPLAKADS